MNEFQSYNHRHEHPIHKHHHHHHFHDHFHRLTQSYRSSIYVALSRKKLSTCAYTSCGSSLLASLNSSGSEVNSKQLQIGITEYNCNWDYKLLWGLFGSYM